MSAQEALAMLQAHQVASMTPAMLRDASLRLQRGLEAARDRQVIDADLLLRQIITDLGITVEVCGA